MSDAPSLELEVPDVDAKVAETAAELGVDAGKLQAAVYSRYVEREIRRGPVGPLGVRGLS